MVLEKKLDLSNLILKLLQKHTEISHQNVAEAAGLSSSDDSQRKRISRAFKKLIEKNLIVTKGDGRARVYYLKERINTKEDEKFKGIPLSSDSVTLLQYISQPIEARAPVGYNQEFLRLYIPNQTSYLSSSQGAELLALGQAENIARPAGTYARDILNRLLIDLSWNSSRLEGNTYSLLETKRLIELSEVTEGKDLAEAQMILNHKNAIEYIVESSDEPEISAHQIYSIHALLSENLLGDPSASGRIRKIAVGITSTTYLPLENHYILQECFEIFVQKLNLIKDPFEQSFFAFIHLSYLQAFEDVNKRTARLVSNIPFIKKNLKPLSFADLHKDTYVTALLSFYEKTDISLIRDLFIWAYKRSCQKYSAVQQSMGAPNLFKLKYRNAIYDIVRTIILEKINRKGLVLKIKELIKTLNLSESDAEQMFQIIETEIASLHAGNIARFKIKLSEFNAWQDAI